MHTYGWHVVEIHVGYTQYLLQEFLWERDRGLFVKQSSDPCVFQHRFCLFQSLQIECMELREIICGGARAMTQPSYVLIVSPEVQIPVPFNLIEPWMSPLHPLTPFNRPCLRKTTVRSLLCIAPRRPSEWFQEEYRKFRSGLALYCGPSRFIGISWWSGKIGKIELQSSAVCYFMRGWSPICVVSTAHGLAVRAFGLRCEILCADFLSLDIYMTPLGFTQGDRSP